MALKASCTAYRVAPKNVLMIQTENRAMKATTKVMVMMMTMTDRPIPLNKGTLFSRQNDALLKFDAFRSNLAMRPGVESDGSKIRFFIILCKRKQV